MPVLKVFFSAFILLLLTACGSPPAEDSAVPTPEKISIVPYTNPIYQSSAAIQLSLIGTFAGGLTEDLTAKATWASSDESIAKISNSGQLQAVAPGTVIISTTYKGVSASYSFTILSDLLPAEEIVSIGIKTTANAYLIGQSGVKFSIFVFYKDSSFSEIATGITWGSSNQTIATIDALGNLVFKAEGEVEINAIYQDFSASQKITVKPGIKSIAITSTQQSYFAMGDFVQLSLLAAFTDNSSEKIVDGIVWQTSDDTRATVTQDGLLNPLTVGPVDISATVFNLETTLSIYIDEIETNSIEPIQAFGKLPSKIVSTFKVLDGQGKPITGLAASGSDSWKTKFLVEENGVDVGKRSESFAQIIPIEDAGLVQPLVFALDISASISDSDFSLLIESIRNMIYIQGSGGQLESKLLAGQTVSLVIFDQTADVWFGATNNLTIIAQKLNELALLNRQSRVDNNSTDLYGGTIKGLSQWNNESSSEGIVQGFLVLITDGAHESGTSSLSDVIAARGNKDVVVIFTAELEAGAAIPTELSKIASNGQVITTKGDFSLITLAVDTQNQLISDQLSSIYQLEYVTPKRQGTWELKVSLLDGSENVPYIFGQYDASKFTKTTPAEIKLSGVSAKGSSTKAYFNVSPQTEKLIKATTNWTAKQPDYVWTNHSFLVKNPTDNTIAALKMDDAQSDVIKIIDKNNYVAGTSPAQNVSFELAVNSSHTELVLSKYKLVDKEEINILALSSASAPSLFNWRIVEELAGADCKLAAKDSTTFADTLFNVTEAKLKINSETKLPGSCVIRVIDLANDGAIFDQYIVINEQGTAIDMSAYNPSDEKLIDFEDGQLAASMTGDWVVSENTYTATQGQYQVHSKKELAEGKASVLRMTVREAKSIQFQYKLNKGAGDEFGFFINKAYTKAAFYSDKAENDSEFKTTATYTFDGYEAPFLLEWIFIRSNNPAQNGNQITLDNIVLKK